jgi:hypothetical protein
LVLDNIWALQENFTDEDVGGTKSGRKKVYGRLYVHHYISQNLRLSTRLADLHIM